jgi:hypothetical protein
LSVCYFNFFSVVVVQVLFLGWGGPTIRTLAHLWGLLLLQEKNSQHFLFRGEEEGSRKKRKNSTTASYTHSRQVGWKHPCKEARECVEREKDHKQWPFLNKGDRRRCTQKWPLIAATCETL